MEIESAIIIKPSVGTNDDIRSYIIQATEMFYSNKSLNRALLTFNGWYYLLDKKYKPSETGSILDSYLRNRDG